MERAFADTAAFTVTMLGLFLLFPLSLGVYWLFNKQARLRDIAELRIRMAQLAPNDPEYGTVRALYTSMVIDAERWHFFHADAAPNDHGGSDHHVSSDAAAGGSDHH
ncbi:MAG: hypothetical protein WA418_29955 [Bradyrhizobium sp.]